jgi:hypothetical protein
MVVDRKQTQNSADVVKRYIDAVMECNKDFYDLTINGISIKNTDFVFKSPECKYKGTEDIFPLVLSTMEKLWLNPNIVLIATGEGERKAIPKKNC